MQKLSHADCQQSIPLRFEQIVKEMPHHIALHSGSTELCYDELNARSNRIAHALLDRIGDRPEPVILLLEDTIHNVSAQLGVLKSGKTCIPIDVEFPVVRQNEIFSDSGSRLILTEKKHLARAQAIAPGDDSVFCVEDAGAIYSTNNPNLFIGPAILAYILYTSGSTGHPKGVMQSHRSLLHHCMIYTEALGAGNSDRLTTPTSFAYTVTLWVFLTAILNGATFVRTKFESPILFLESLIQERIHVVHLLVTLLRQFLDSLDGPFLSDDLRMVFTGGELLSKEDVVRFAEISPRNCELGYNYGSTEAGLLAYTRFTAEDVKRLPGDDPSFPIGPIVQDARVEFLDPDGKAAEVGQIAIRSHYLADGYWKQPELTEKHFPAHSMNEHGRVYLTGDLGRLSEDGRLICIGRNDSQVKIRGYLVHLNEIENALCSLPGIKAAAVRAMDRGHEKMDLIAYIRPEKSFKLIVAELRRTLALRLPRYMIPASFVTVERFPLTGSGKLNRRALPDPGVSRPDLDIPFESAKTDTQKALCDFFCESMSLESIGIRDHLLDLGADSLTFFRVIGQIQRHFEIEVPPRAFLDTPYIEALAQTIDQLKQSKASHGR